MAKTCFTVRIFSGERTDLKVECAPFMDPKGLMCVKGKNPLLIETLAKGIAKVVEKLVVIESSKEIPFKGSDVLHHVNAIYSSTVNNERYVLKGAWNGSPKGVCWLMRADGSGHSYTGAVHSVENVWDITPEEFSDITGGHIDWFKREDA